MADTQIKQLMRIIGALQASIGLKSLIKNLPEIERKKTMGRKIQESLQKLGINPQNIVMQDVEYYSCSWEEAKPVLEAIYSVVKNFNWTADVFDCDNRAALVSSLCGMFAGMNTCAYVHCDRNNLDGKWSGGHLTNVFIDKDGNTYLFDVDNWGMMQKIDGQNPVMGREKYTFDSARVY